MKHRCFGLGGLPQEEVETLAWHEVDVATLVRMHNPLRAWTELKSPIEPSEVQACLAAGQEALCETPLWSELAFGKVSLSDEEVRRRHIAKIAYFVRHAPETPPPRHVSGRRFRPSPVGASAVGPPPSVPGAPRETPGKAVFVRGTCALAGGSPTPFAGPADT